jgi:anthranilate phosphoribosyltransferase
MCADSGFQAPREEHPFARYVRILGKGKTGTRSLTEVEAREAFRMILRGEIDPVQLGAFLMLLRVKEESPEELAGFVRACREEMVSPPRDLVADLDWSSYAGKRHQHPWFLLAVRLLADAGYRVFLHGAEGHTEGRLYTEGAMRQLNLPVANDWTDVEHQLDRYRISYLPLRHFCLPLHDMMQLRHLLGLRSPVNTLTRLLNPLASPCSLQSVFHPAYADLHQRADELLGQAQALVFKGESGEIELKPHADTQMQLLRDGTRTSLSMERVLPERPDSVTEPGVEPLRALWRKESSDNYGTQAVLATTAAALILLRRVIGPAQARQEALSLWESRDAERLD